MKRNLKKAITALLAAIIAASAFAASAATVTPNSGYTVVTEDFSKVKNNAKVSETRDADGDGVVDSQYKESTIYPIGDSDWALKTCTASGQSNTGDTDAWIANNTLSFATNNNTDADGFGGSSNGYIVVQRRSVVYYNGDYSDMGNSFKIKYDYTKSINCGLTVKFMISDDIRRYYALNMEGKAGAVWTLYKVENAIPTVLAKSDATITATNNKAGSGSTNKGTITVAYDNGKIMWNINANRFGNYSYIDSGSYTDTTPFAVAASACKIGFSTNGNKGQWGTLKNITISYATANVSENFEGLGIVSDTIFANTTTGSRTQITGTDFYVTTRENSLGAKLSAKVVGNVKDDFGTTSTRLEMTYPSWIFSKDQINKLDFVEYRGDYTGIRDNYTISFDYAAGSARNSAALLFGLPANDADNYEYNDYYALVFNGESALKWYEDGNVTTVPSWEIRKMDTNTWSGTDKASWPGTIAASDSTFSKETKPETSSAADDYVYTMAKYGTKAANVTVNVNRNTVTVSVSGIKSNKERYTDTKTFTATLAGNHFAFLNNSAYKTFVGYFDNISVTTTQSAIESDADNLYINSGKFALGDGSLLFYNNDGTCTLNPIKMNTFETHKIAIPSGTKKIFFWKDLDTIIPITESIDIE